MTRDLTLSTKHAVTAFGPGGLLGLAARLVDRPAGALGSEVSGATRSVLTLLSTSETVATRRDGARP